MSELIITKEDAHWLEKHHVDDNVTPFNASPSFMVKNHFAKYFQDIFFKAQIEREKPQQQCMTKLYELVLTFEHLERLISNPSSANPKSARQDLHNAVSAWKGEFIQKLTAFLQSNSTAVEDLRAKQLIEKLSADIEKNTQTFLDRLDSKESIHLRQLFAAHDLGHEMSLGHLIALNLDALLSTGLKLSYHHSPHSILNLWYVDRAIASLSNAKTDLRMQNFSLEGHMKTSPVHAYSNTILSRLNIKDSVFESYSYPAPASNPSAAERLLILHQASKDKKEHNANLLYQSTCWQYSLKIALAAVDTLFLSLVALNLFNYMALKCLNLLGFNYFDTSISNHYQNCQRNLNWLYMCLSPLHYFQQYENQRIKTHWENHGLFSDTSKDFRLYRRICG